MLIHNKFHYFFVKYSKILLLFLVEQGLDYCYDCTAEVYILWKYLVKCQHYPENDSRTWKAIAEMIDTISSTISSGMF
jgi:hypothetical protein